MAYYAGTTGTITSNGPVLSVQVYASNGSTFTNYFNDVIRKLILYGQWI